MENQNIIKCENCGAEINVSEILYHQVEDKLKKEFLDQSAKKDKDLKLKLDALAADKEQLAKDRESVQEQIKSEVKSKLAAEKSSLEKTIKKQLTEEAAGELKLLQDELKAKSEQVKELNRTKAEVTKLKREKDELRDQVALEKEQEFSEKLKEEKIKIKKQVDESSAEWRHITEKNKIPYLIGVKHNDFPDQFKPFTFGGVYDRWTDTESGEVRETFSIITTPANSMMEIIHNSKKRMPLIIPEEKQHLWLTTTEADDIRKLMVPFPSERMMAYPISKNISQRNTPKNIPETLLAQEYEEVSMYEFL